MLLCLSPSRIYNKSLVQNFDPQPNKKLGSCSISFLVFPGRSPGKMLLFLSPSRIYNTLSIQISSRKKQIKLLFYILSGSPMQKSWHNVFIPERYYDISDVNHFDPQPQKKKIRQLFYILSGSPRQKSWHDVFMPERIQDI